MSLKMFASLGDEHVIAESLEDVRAVLAEIHSEYDPEDEWSPLATDEPFRFDHQDARGVETKTVAEWIAESGRGYFAGPI